MEILVNGQIKRISLLDEYGFNYIEDFLGNLDALSKHQFLWSEDHGCYIADKDTFEFWKGIIDKHQLLNNKVAELRKTHTNDEIMEVLQGVDTEIGGPDWEYADSAMAALEEVFGN